MRRIALAVLVLALAAGCAGQTQRGRGAVDEETHRRPFAEPGEGTELRLAAPPPVNRTPVSAASPWADEAIQVALDELSIYRVKGPEEIKPLLNQSPVGEAYDRFAAQPDDPEVMLAAALAIGRAARCDYVMMEVIDRLARDGDSGAGYPAILVAYRAHLVHVASAKVLWSQGYSTRLQPKTDEAEPAIRWALLQSGRDLVARIPWRKER
ncbi:MAG: hypothetical protein FJZ00_02170 [Candidatus Sericytochromatia bacterium]|uniref:Uncharacterized protein n=1 Tax=Candidatus Tanganyikabacteria bacterium TaxID=2961651 RepID=A0A937X5D9_9BACT|nr:hypothetical protein [Candidatus Tanganyikabacteria bacterium]